MIKRHLHLKEQSLTQSGHVHDDPVNQEPFAELNCSASQIEQYLFNILSVPKALAITLLGNPLTSTTLEFIDSYLFQEVGNNSHDNLMARYVHAVLSNSDSKPAIQPYEQELITRLLVQPLHLEPKTTKAMEPAPSMPLFEEKTPTPNASVAELKTADPLLTPLMAAIKVPKMISRAVFDSHRSDLLLEAKRLADKLADGFIKSQRNRISSFFSFSSNSNELAKNSAYSQQIAFVGSLTNILLHLSYEQDVREEIQALKEDFLKIIGLPNQTSSIVMELKLDNSTHHTLMNHDPIQILLTSIESLSQASVEFSRVELPQPGPSTS